MSEIKSMPTITANSVANALSEAYPHLSYGAVPLVDQLEAVEAYLDAHCEHQPSTSRINPRAPGP